VEDKTMKNEASEESTKIIHSEGIIIYDISPEALKYYRNNAHSGAASEEEVIRRKLTGLVMCTHRKKEIDKQKYIYKISGFNIVVNENKKLIEWLYWDRDDHRGSAISKEEREKLIEIYNVLLLNNSGNSFKRTSDTASECNEEALDDTKIS
jgi:hypothetical protein